MPDRLGGGRNGPGCIDVAALISGCRSEEQKLARWTPIIEPLLSLALVLQP